MTEIGRGTTRKQIEVAIGVEGSSSAVKTSLRRLKVKGLLDSVKGAPPVGGGRAEELWYECTTRGLQLMEQYEASKGGDNLETELQILHSRGERQSSSFFNLP